MTIITLGKVKRGGARGNARGGEGAVVILAWSAPTGYTQLQSVGSELVRQVERREIGVASWLKYELVDALMWRKERERLRERGADHWEVCTVVF